MKRAFHDRGQHSVVTRSTAHSRARGVSTEVLEGEVRAPAQRWAPRFAELGSVATTSRALAISFSNQLGG